MKTSTEKQQIINAITGTAEILGTPLSPAAAAMMMGDLSTYPTQDILNALSAVRRDSPRRLTLGDVLAKLEAVSAPQRRAPNEAWSMAVRARDERETVIWTNEMAQAWSAALPLVNEGDMVAARMAFIEAYQRIVTAAKDAGRQPEVLVSLGWDYEGRAAAIDEARSSGMLTHKQAVAEAAKHGLAISGPSQAIALPSPAEKMATAEQFQALAHELAERLRRHNAETLEALQAEYDASQAALERLRAEGLDKVRQALEGAGNG